MKSAMDETAGLQTLIDGNGDTFTNKPAFYDPATASQSQALPAAVSLSTFIGLANLVYNTLQAKNTTLEVNGTLYKVVDSVDDTANSYQGYLLFDATTNSYFVVNRGTKEPGDIITDAVMAVAAINNQWSDALALANEAKTDAAARGSTVYAVGHSLGGSLAQLQAADFGWVGYTFNAYGASDVFTKLGLTLNSHASIKNYRTLFDVVSDVSTHLGDQPITLESIGDVKLLASGSPTSPGDLITTIKSDHSLSNFFTPTSDTPAVNKGQDHVYNAANAFQAPASGQMVALTEDRVSGLAYVLKAELPILGALPIGDLTGAQLAAQAWQYINDQSVSGIKAIVPVDVSLLSDALNASTSNNIERASLASLSAAVLQGVDPSTLSSFTLWAPGQTTGLTKEYLVARNDMVLAMVAMAGAGQVAGGSVGANGKDSYTYTDLNRSPNPLYTLNGLGGSTYDVVFANDTGDGLTVAPGAYAELFGGAGNDTLFGGTVSSTLQGGAGYDDYIINGDGTGVDSILDTDGKGKIEWKSGGTSQVLTGGNEVTGTSAWKSADGTITYFEDLAADGSTELEITSKNKIAYVDNFTNGEFGITLNVGTPAPVGSSNLSQLRDAGIVGNTSVSGEAHHIYQDDLTGATVDSIYGADSSSNSYGNEIMGEGNAHYIYAGNGNNIVLLGDFYQRATAPLISPLNATIQGGSGDQQLIGVGNGTETITGGAVGTDTSAVTYIDGGGATALLGGGGQNSVIYGGTGADTLAASSADGTSTASFNPFTMEIAGLSFYGDAYSSQVDGTGKSYELASLPQVSWLATSPDSAQFSLALYQSDGTYSAPVGLLGSSLDSGASDGATSLPGSVLIGGTGEDWLIGNRGNDTLIGGNPLNALNGVTDEVLVGGAGADVIYGGGGTEIIYADMSPGAVSNWAGLDPNNADTIYGGTGTEFIYGSGGKDVIYGGSGTDVIHAGNGGGYIDTGSGNASVYGGSGNDTIVADGASNYILAGGGNSYIEAARGLSAITTGAGSDTVEAAGGSALITEGSGSTTLIAGTSTGSDTIHPSSGGTTVQLIDGLTESTLVVRDVNGDLVLSDPGFDTQVTIAGYFNAPTGASLQFADGTTWGAAEILQAAIKPRSDGGNDTLVGSDGTDSITAGYGDTSIVGTSGNNTLTGGYGNDTIQGGSGADTIEGGSGTTQIHGGTGQETYVHNLADGSDTIYENATTVGADTLKFGAGISASDLTYGYDPTSNALVIGFGALSNATLTVMGFEASQPNQHQITTFSFADGTSLTQLQVFQKAVAIDGTTGNDSLVGTAGTDYFDGESGNDTAVGNGGNDTFVFNSGYGHLAINETYTSAQTPVLQLGAGITASALHVTSDGYSVMLADGVSGDLITLDGMFSNSNTGVATVQLADGTSLMAAQLIQMEMTGTTGSDTIYGTSGADLIDGKGGSDLEYGKGGSDTFVFNSGYGDLEINESYTSGQAPVLRLGTGITASALHVTSDGTSLMLTDGVSGDQIILDSMLSTSGDGVATVQLADGTSLTASQLIQMEMTGTTGSDVIYGTTGADLIDGKGGSDSVVGNGGSDTFVFDAGYGQLRIDENYASGEQPVLQLGAGITVSALHVTSDGSNLLLTEGLAGDQITLENMWNNSANGIGMVQLADGTTLTRAQLAQMEMTGTTGDDTLYGTSGADLIDGKGGSKGNNDGTFNSGAGDYEVGNGGNDTFVFDAGYGQLSIYEDNSNGQLEPAGTFASGRSPVLELGPGITLSDLKVTLGNNIFLTDGTSGDQIALVDEAIYGGFGVAVVQLADGTTLTAAQLLQMGHSITGTTGNDTLQAINGDTIDGMGGNDLVNGSRGDDTIVFNPGYGQLEINQFSNPRGVTDFPTTSDYPVVQLGAGITVSMLHVTTTPGYDKLPNTYGGPAAPGNIVITDGISGDQITLDNTWNFGDSTLKYVQFADGTSLTLAQLEQMEINGSTTGNDTIYGTLGGDLIDGKGGNDIVYGSGFSDDDNVTYSEYAGAPDDGNDTFVFNAGYGHLEITDQYSTSQPILALGQGITASSLHVTSDGTSLYLTDGTSGDEITLFDMFHGATGWGSTWGVASVQLADGTTLTRSQLIQMEMAGTTGNDTIYGTSGADLIDGTGGDDSVNGEGGNDTFVFNAGYGKLTINETYSSGQQPVLQLGAGITASALKVTADGANLMLTDGVSGDQVTLDNMWSSGSSKGVGIVKFADGTSLTAAQLIQMGLSGTTGNDTIVGTPGADLIDGKGGNDSVNGGGGNDTFVFNAGYGKLAIYELQSIYGSSPNQAVLKFGSGISSSALHVTEDDRRDLILTDGIAGDQITIQSPFKKGYQAATAWGTNVEFSDGSTLDMSQLQQMASNLNGTTGSDYLVGTTGADRIDGKGGNDYAIGNGGSDTFVFNQGYGALEIGEASAYTVQLGPGITRSNLHAFVGQDSDIVLTDGTPGDVIRLDDAYNDILNSGVVIKFTDGTTLSLSQLDESGFYTYSGDEIYRLGMNSTSRALFADEGHVSIFYVDGITSADVAVQCNANGYLTLTNKSTGSQFTIPGYSDGSQGVSITFSDGVTWGGAQILQAMETGGPGNDTLSGTSGVELFDGKGGNDSIIGNGGSDTFVFNSGYGDLEINEVYTSGQQPVLRLGAGITVSTLQVNVVGANVVLTDGVSGDQITLDNQNSSGTDGVALVQFADGTSVTAAQLIQISKEIAGTAGNDTLTGTSGADWIDGKGGNDSVIGNGGSDTFVFNAGYGDLEINEAYTSGQQPILRLGAGITASALEVTANGANVVLTDGISGDRITLDNQNSSGSDGVALVQFADGTTLTAAQLTLRSKEIRGTTGNDTLTGTSGADWIDGKGGNDSVIGNGGNDTFVFNSGYGHLEINEAYTTGQQPILQLGAGIASSALQVALVGANVVLTDGVSGDQITLDNQNASGSDGIALVQFADGTSLTAAQLVQMSHEFIGTTGNDLLTGNSGADLIDGKGGNDTVVGNGGNDTFVFNAGYGQLDIREQYTSGQTPMLQLGAGITSSNLKVTPNASGSGMVLTDGTSGDQITLENAVFNDSIDGVQEVKFADGTSLTEAQLVQMETSLPGNGGSVTGGSGNDTLVADTANESLIGGTGNEVFDFNTGFGQDTLVANGTASSNTILFGVGITVSDLSFSTDGSELTITDTKSTGADSQASSIMLPGHFVNGQPVTDVGELMFNDGSSISMAQINQLFASSPPPPPPPTTVLTAGADNTLVSDNGVDLLQANDGNDTLTGGSGTDTLESSVGNTLMNGGTGTETYLFNTGFGQDTVVANGSAASNTILFGAGITVSNLNFSTDGSELTITDTSSTGADSQASSITLPGHFVNGSPVTDVGELLFNDGSYVTMAQINQLFAAPAPAPSPTPTTTLTAGTSNTLVSDNGVDLLQANSGNDTLTGGSGTDTLESGVGNTLMNGGVGTETYLFNTGFGQDTVVANGTATSNTILFGAGITSSNLNFSTDGSELTITDTSSTGADGQASSITLPGHFVNGSPVTDVGELLFNDGSYVTMAQINQLFASSSTSSTAGTTAAPMMTMAATDHSSAVPPADLAIKSTNGSGTHAVNSYTSDAPHGTGVYGSDLCEAPAIWRELMRQSNTLTHAIASYTGGGSGGETTMPITHAAPVDLMLHVAA